MTKNQLTFVLVGVLFLSTLLGVLMLWNYHSATRNLQQVSQQWFVIQNTERMLPSLVAEIREYGKKNPAINPILDSAATNPAPAAVNKPANK